MGAFLSRIADWVVAAFTTFFHMLIAAIVLMLDGFLRLLSALIPGVNLDYASVAPYFSAVNAWVPIDVGFTLLAAYMAIEAAVLMYRTIKKHIPTES